MNPSLNSFHSVLSLTNEYKDSRLFTSYHYESKLVKGTLLALAIIGILGVLTSIVLLSSLVFFISCGLIIAILLYCMSSSSSFSRFCTKSIASLFWGTKIEEKVLETKSRVRSALCEGKSILEDMRNSGEDWRKVAQDAQKIMDFQL